MTDEDVAPHPSYFELDRWSLGASSDAAATARHVAGCARCRAHIDALSRAAPVPAGLREACAAAGAGDGVRGRVSRWLPWRGGRGGRAVGVTGFAVALAAVVLWLGARPGAHPVRPPGLDDGSALGSKGLPSVWIYVRHEDELALWDGQRPFAPGDRLRLKIDPQDLTRVDVFSRDEADADRGGAGRGGASLVPVFSGQLSAGTVNTLPVAWQLDGSRRRQSLFVALSRQGVSAQEGARFIERGAPPGVWLRRFELRAAVPGAAAPGSSP
jgi:hypothetical protein